MKKFTLLGCTTGLMICVFGYQIVSWISLLFIRPPEKLKFPNIETIIPSLHFFQENTVLIGSIFIILNTLSLIGAIVLIKRKKWAHTLLVLALSLIASYSVIQGGILYFELESAYHALTEGWQGSEVAFAIKTKENRALIDWVATTISSAFFFYVLLRKQTVEQLES